MQDARKLQTAQNNCLRAILKANGYCSSIDLHNQTEIEFLAVQRKRATCIEAHKCVHGLGPPNLAQEFRLLEQNRELRSSDKLTLMPTITKTKFAEKDFVFRGKSLWHQLPEDWKTEDNVGKLKEYLKKESWFS